MQEEVLQTALEAAHSAGDLLVQRMWTQREVTLKGYRDTVTDADTAAEGIVIGAIRDRFPEHSILSEEAGGDELDSSYTWIIDPLDGTTNYARGHPTFSVSIAVLQDGQPVLGVVRDPVRRHTFAAQRGEGVIFNGQKVHTSTVSDIGDALVSLDWAHTDSHRAQILRRLEVLAPRCRTVRTIGSAALALAWVGMGWLDVYFSAGLYAWDTAAGGLIVTEAGGSFSGWDGVGWSREQSRVLATNGLLHASVLQLWGNSL